MSSEISGGLPPASSISGRHAPSVGRADLRLEALSGFWTKLNNDWIFNLAGLLAYNFLMPTGLLL
jgi:hypothetical protein